MKYLIVLLLILVSGCISESARNVPATNPTTQQIISQTISSTDWLFSLLMIGAVIGVFSGLNGMKVGWAATASCIAGLFLKAALSSTWVYWFCGLLFVGSILAALASILWKNKSVKELILSCQYMKQAVPDEQRVRDIFSLQSKDTKSLVNTIKAKMKTKGELV